MSETQYRRRFRMNSILVAIGVVLAIAWWSDGEPLIQLSVALIIGLPLVDLVYIVLRKRADGPPA